MRAESRMNDTGLDLDDSTIEMFVCIDERMDGWIRDSMNSVIAVGH